jgi:hypothetical protein
MKIKILKTSKIYFARENNSIHFDYYVGDF